MYCIKILFFLDGPEPNKEMSVKVQQFKEKEEYNIRYTVLIMFIF
jgi:hypothetical protein